ncbi:MAG TPA: alpha/beta hydrolase [Nocardioidaceae bacterium]|nr:alpha/beta hydrolase [Nocardioidaceae bacterium]
MAHGDRELVTLPDGRRLHLWHGGAPDGPTVWFLPGCPDSRLAALPGAAAARRVGVRVVAVNRPGYGLSDTAEPGHLSVADDIAAVADRLGIEVFSVLGMSLGGPYALACAARHPSRVRSVGVVACPAPTPELDPPWHRDDLSPEQQKFFAGLALASVEECVEQFRPGFEEYVERMAPLDQDDLALARRSLDVLDPQDARLLERLAPSDLAASCREALGRTDGYLRDAAATFRRWDFDPARVECPTWLWYGSGDANVSPRNGQWLADRIPRANLVLREGTSHLSTLHEHWEEILARLS